MQSQDVKTTMELSRHMSPTDFAAYGTQEIAYVKTIDQEGSTAFAVHAADGTQLTVMTERDQAFAVIRQNDLEPVSAH
ncbi:DUF1150 family protein [Fodinicurvata sp. EGI_FJ10296]|jgi:hypothetical protein|uniref:DUF1150 family protein n=1 Tax=Fodinicurvata sp. EGI_FJ10296 TaxID=3231908 RepID=UPI003454722D